MTDDKGTRFLIWIGNLFALFDAVTGLLSFGYINYATWFWWTGFVSERRVKRHKDMNDNLEKILRSTT